MISQIANDDEDEDQSQSQLSGHQLCVVCEDTPTHADKIPTDVRRRLSVKRFKVKRLIFKAKLDANKAKDEYMEQFPK